MPVRNVVRVEQEHTFYHVYNRGHNKDALFVGDQDYRYFEWLLERCFGPVQLKNEEGRLFPWFGDKVQLQAYCLMPNHYHLLLYQNEERAIAKAMQSLGTTYSLYFNKRYGRRGSAFESVYKSSPILSDIYLQHITRYIHLNPRDYSAWRYSSYADYVQSPHRLWIASQPILNLFDGRQHYVAFVEDYIAVREGLAELKYALADFGETY